MELSTLHIFFFDQACILQIFCFQLKIEYNYSKLSRHDGIVQILPIFEIIKEFWCPQKSMQNTDNLGNSKPEHIINQISSLNQTCSIFSLLCLFAIQSCAMFMQTLHIWQKPPWPSRLSYPLCEFDPGLLQSFG